MSGPSPYNALYAIFGNDWPIKDKDHQQYIKIIKKSKKQHNEIHDKKEHKPLKIDNACQTQPLRDYSYNKVVGPSKRKTNKKNHDKCDKYKIYCNDNARYSRSNKTHKNSIGVHLKNSHVNALYKTVSDIERFFREERNLHLHSRKCLCNSCGALGVITESMKHPVDFSEGSSESDDDDSDDDDDDEDDDYYEALPRYNSSKRSWKIEYKDSENIKYGMPSTEGYLRLIVELEKMIKRVHSLERLAVKNKIPSKRNKVGIAFDVEAKRFNSVPKKLTRSSSSTSSSEIDKKQCRLFSIPNVIKRRFSKKGHIEIQRDQMMKAPTSLRSKNYKHKTNVAPDHHKYEDMNKKYKSYCLDEKIQNFDLSLLNEDEICELMFHLKNKDAQRMKQRTITPSNTEKHKGFSNRKPETQSPKSNQIHNLEPGSSKKRSPTTTIAKKPSHRSLRNDATFIRRSSNYLENDVDTKRHTRNLFDDFLKINNVIPAEQYNNTHTQQRSQKVLQRDGSGTTKSTFYNLKNVSQNDTLHRINLDITEHEGKSERDYDTKSNDSLLYESSNYSQIDWIKEIINKSIGVIEEKYNQEMEISENSIKGKIGKTVTYSKQNEYHYFEDSLLDIKSDSKSYNNSLEIGESSGLCKKIHQEKQIDSSDSDLSREFEAYFIKDFSRPKRKINEKFTPLTKCVSKSEIEFNIGKNDVSDTQESTLSNEDLNKHEVKIIELPKNNSNQFKHEKEINPLRSELRSKNENTTNKLPIRPVKIEHDEKISEFISNSIFEKPLLKDVQSLFKKDNGELKPIQKIGNKILTETNNNHRKYFEEPKKLQNSITAVESKSSYLQVNEDKSLQMRDNNHAAKNKTFKRKENKETQITEINDELESNSTYTEDDIETHLIQKEEIRNSASKKNFNKHDKNFEESNFNEQFDDLKNADEANKKIDKEKIVKRKETKGTQVTDINEEQDTNFLFDNNKEVTFLAKGVHTKILENDASDRKDSEELRKIQKNGTYCKFYEGEKPTKPCTVDENAIKTIRSNIKENKGIQATDIIEEKENIIEEIHECALSSVFNKNNNSHEIKKSILKTYKRAVTESPSKFDTKNSQFTNKLKKHVSLNIFKKVSSSIIHDIFKRKTGHNIALTKVFERKKSSIKNKENKITYSRIPVPVSQPIKNDIGSNLPKKSKFTSKIPVYSNKTNSKSNFEKKCNQNIPRNFEKKLNQNIPRKFEKECNQNIPQNFEKNIPRKNMFNQTHDNVFVHYNVVKKAPSSKCTKKNEIPNSQETIVIGKTIYKNCALPKPVLTKKKCSKIPVLIMKHNNKKEQNEVCKKTIPTKSSGNNSLVLKGKKAFICPSSLVTSNNFLPTFPQNIQLYSAFISVPSSNVRKQEENNILPIGSNILNSFNSQMEKIEHKLVNEAKVIPTNFEAAKSLNFEATKSLNFEAAKCLNFEAAKSLNFEVANSLNFEAAKSLNFEATKSLNSEVEKIEPKIDATEAIKLLPVESDILTSYNSQIEKVERKIVSYSTDDGKKSNNPTTESIIPNDDTEEKSIIITSPFTIETYESSCTFSENSSGAIFIYKSKCLLGTDMSVGDSDTHVSESVYTSTSDLSSLKKKQKWKWFKTFGNKFKSFLSVNTLKSSTVEKLLVDDSTSCKESNETSNGKDLEKKENESSIKKFCRIKWNNKPKISSLSFTLALKKKDTTN